VRKKQGGWIKNTGKQPVFLDTLVDVKFAEEDIDYGRPAKEWWWEGTAGTGSIVEWRLHGAILSKEPCEETGKEICQRIDSIIQELVELKGEICSL